MVLLVLSARDPAFDPRFDSDIDGCEFLLVSDDGNFSEDSTFLLTNRLAHTRATYWRLQDVGQQTAKAPLEEALHISAPKPGALFEDRKKGSGPVPHTFSHRLLQQGPKPMAGGSVRIVDSMNFPASKTIAAALVELDPGALRELHWHPNADEWQY